MNYDNPTIVAPATATGGALSVVRLSGSKSIEICDRLFRGRQSLKESKSHTLHFGAIYHNDRLIDEVVVSIFHSPHSYTGEESVEISCHGSRYITSQIISAAIDCGAQLASPGEFTQRAYLSGKLDLSQAEAVADLIAAESQAAHNLALNQMRGGYSDALAQLYDKLLQLSSLLELELDFSEEDVEFADRKQLAENLNDIDNHIQQLLGSFRLGNALKNGIQTVIVGEPNVGKSTLLNRLVGEERAMVSSIAGTTRDTIEEVINIDGVEFRLIDTAGLHATTDSLEQMGIDRTHRAIGKANIVMQIVDATQDTYPRLELQAEQIHLLIINKIDTLSQQQLQELQTRAFAPTTRVVMLSAKSGEGCEKLLSELRQCVDTSALERGEIIVSNNRHISALGNAKSALEKATHALETQLTSDLLAEELRQVSHHLGEILGTITPEGILQTIFSKFCIGK